MNNPTDGNKNRVTVYLIVATLCMALGGLFNSLSGLFLLMGFSLGCVFYYLAYIVNRGAQPESQNYEHARRQAKPVYTTPISVQNSRKVVFIAAAFVGGVFFVIIVTTFLFSDGAEDTFYYKARGDNSFQTGDYDSAKFFYRKVLKADPSDTETMLAYGNSLLETRDFDSADYYYDRVLETEGENIYAMFNKALSQYRQQNYHDAIAKGQSIIDIDPSYYNADQLVADSYYAMSSYDSAFQYYNIAYDGGVRGSWICHVLGYLYDLRGNTTQAIELYKEALTYDDSITDIYQRLGELVPGEEGAEYRRRAAQK